MAAPDPGARPGRLRLLGLVALLSALLVVATVQWRQGRMVSEVMLESTDNWASNFYEVGTEYYRLRSAWTEAATEPGLLREATRDGLKLRLDILASRVGLLREAHRATAIGVQPEVALALQQVAGFVEDADAAFERSAHDPGQLPLGPLLLRLRAQEGAVRTLTQHVAGVVAAAASERAAAVERQNRIGIAVTAVLCLLTAFFASVTVRQLRAADERRARLEATAGELRAARQVAEQASRAKSAFLANMSHEIRTPMNATIGVLHLLQRDITDPLQQDRLGKAEGAARHLLQVINGILDLSKIEAGKMDLELRSFRLDDVLDQALALVRVGAAEKGLALIVDASTMPQHLVGDPTRLSQMLINLLSNAVKFTERGWVRVRVAPERRDGDRLWIRFEVQDTGPGIPDGQQAQLFADFEQLDTSTTRRHGGSGLGLALTRRFAGLMGGDAGLSSRVGAGSSFWFTVALRCAPEGEAEPPRSALQGLRVLLVGGLAEAREATAATLCSLGLQVDSCAEPAAAQQVLALGPAGARAPDLLVVDEPALQALQGVASPGTARAAGAPAVVLLTDTRRAEAVRAGLEGRVDAVLAQPMVARAWADALERLLRGRAVALAEAVPATAEDLLRAHHAGQWVLLAEDNPINQEVAAALLQAVGLQVETAADGERAVELARTLPCALVLMDVQMPVLDGLGAARAIRTFASAEALPILAMTANVFGEDQRACLEAGMNEHLAKPIEAEQLYRALLRWLPPRVAQAPRPAAVEPMAPGLAERLARIPGYAVERALASAGGHVGRLSRMLAAYAAAYMDGDARLAQAIGRGDLAGVAAAAHSIRGASATLGAVGVAERAQALEARAAQGGDAAEVLADARALEAQLAALARALQVARESGP